MFKKMYVYAHVFICVTHVCRYLQRPEEGAVPPRARITSGCEPLGLGAWNWAGALHKSSMYS